MTTSDGEKAEGELDLGRRLRRRRLETRRGAGSEGEDHDGRRRRDRLDLARDGRPVAAREEEREIPP